MSSSSSPALGPALPRWLLPVLVAAIAVCFAVRNLPWHLDDYDQAKQAYVSFEMVEAGQWWYQHTPTGRIATKPPLAGWVSAALALGTGRSWELAWRLPPLLCAAVMLALLLQAGHELGGRAGAALAAGAFGLNVLSQRLATLVRTDMMLCLSIFLLGYLIYRKLRSGAPWTAVERWQVFGLLLASMLIKGPIAYAFLLPGLLAFWWLQRRTPSPGQAWSGWWSWGAPLLVFALWVGIGIYQSQAFFDQVVLKEFLGRFEAGEGAPHKSKPPYFYIGHLLYRFFPWSLALLALPAVPDVRMKLRRDPALLWLGCWALGGLVVMSIIPSKRVDRIFPIIPPLCLLMSAWVPLWGGGRALPAARLWLYALLLAAGAGSGSYLAYQVIDSYRTGQGGLKAFGSTARRLAGPRTLAVVSGKDEGMLMYAGKTHFDKLDEVVEQWAAGQVQACVLPERIYQARPEKFTPAQVALRSGEIPEKGSAYVLLLRPDSEVLPKKQSPSSAVPTDDHAAKAATN